MFQIHEPPVVHRRTLIDRFTVAKLKEHVPSWLLAVIVQLESRHGLCLALLGVAYWPLALAMAHSHRLYSDELYTYWIAKQPTLHRMVEVSRQIDLHPPLHFLAERASLSLPLPRWLGARLPSLIAGQITLFALFSVGARLRSRMTGLTAAAVFAFTPGLDYSWSNRPYALWLATLALTLWAWQGYHCERTGRKQAFYLLALGVAGTCMTLDYIFGLICLLPFFLAEAVLLWRNRRPTWRLYLALCVPAVAGFTYITQIRSFATNSFAPSYLPSWGSGFEVYGDLVARAGAVLLLCLLIAPLLPVKGKANSESRFSGSMLLVSFCLALLPALLLALVAVHHTQWFLRYGACGSIGIAMLGAIAVERWSANARLTGLLLTVAMLFTSLVRMKTDSFDIWGYWRAEQAMGVIPKRIENLDPSTPIVIASATDFTELNDREPARVVGHLYYLTDRRAAQRYSGQTIFEDEKTTAQLLSLPAHVEPLSGFLASHHAFYLVGSYTSPEEWVFRNLMDQGAKITYQGKFLSTVQAEDLYSVEIEPVPAYIAARPASLPGQDPPAR